MGGLELRGKNIFPFRVFILVVNSVMGELVNLGIRNNNNNNKVPYESMLV